MTLHEEIVRILNMKNTGMTAAEIAKEVNHYGNYKRSDGSPIKASQINARVNKYRHLFMKDNNRINLSDASSLGLGEQKVDGGNTVGIDKSEDAGAIVFLEKNGFKRLSKIGDLLITGMPEEPRLESCGVYAITIPQTYELGFIEIDITKAKKNVVKPWEISRLSEKWVENSMVIYYGIAGYRQPRSLKKRLTELMKHGNGLTNNKGPHKGGEIIWQLKGYEEFLIWYLPTESPPIPREFEKEFLKLFYQQKNRLPFGNRRF